MKKYFFLFLFIIFVSIFIGFHVYHDGNDEFSKILIGTIDKQIIVKSEKVLEKIEKEREAIINRLLAQIDANLAEEYWLYGYENRRTGKTWIEVYADDLEDMHYLAIISSGKESFFESERFYVEIYFISNGNVKNLHASSCSYCSSLEEARDALEFQEKIKGREFIYISTIESYKWPEPKSQEYRLEDLKNTEIYQNFDILIKERGGFDFSSNVEVCLGLWNGYSEEIRMMYKIIKSNSDIYYYDTVIGLDGGRNESINETTKDVYERFKLISVKMDGKYE